MGWLHHRLPKYISSNCAIYLPPFHEGRFLSIIIITDKITSKNSTMYYWYTPQLSLNTVKIAYPSLIAHSSDIRSHFCTATSDEIFIRINLLGSSFLSVPFFFRRLLRLEVSRFIVRALKNNDIFAQRAAKLPRTASEKRWREPTKDRVPRKRWTARLSALRWSHSHSNLLR